MKLLFITIIIVMVYDYAEFPRTFLSRFYSLVFKRNVSKDSVKLPKIFECSFCASFWVTLIYQFFTINIPVSLGLLIGMVMKSLICAFLVPHILHLINIIDRAMGIYLDEIDKAMDKKD